MTLTILTLWSSLILFAQNRDIKFGVVGATQVIQATKFKQAEYQPPNTDFVYQEETEGAGIIDRAHVFNAYALGFTADLTYKKSTLGVATQYFMQRSVFRFQKEQYSERVVGMRAFRLPMYYRLKLFKKKNSMFLSVGTVFTVAQYYDFQHPGSEYLFSDGEIYNGGQDYGDDHFEGILYSKDPYWQYFFEIGKNISDVKVSFRFMSRSKKSNELIAAEIGQVELRISYPVFGLSDFLKKRSIYHE